VGVGYRPLGTSNAAPWVVTPASKVAAHLSRGYTAEKWSVCGSYCMLYPRSYIRPITVAAHRTVWIDRQLVVGDPGKGVFSINEQKDP
jgi:hypothetical protein